MSEPKPLRTVDPEHFKVPYAVDIEKRVVFHIEDGRPQSDAVCCPICNDSVSFVKESDRAAAHFRHKNAAGCEARARDIRQTLHDTVVEAAIGLLNGKYVAPDICTGFGATWLPRGVARREEQQSINGKNYIPDIIIHRGETEKAVTLELEVVFTHSPTRERLEVAAKDGRAIGVLNCSQIERSYMEKLWRREAWDIYEAVQQFIIRQKFEILGDAGIRREITGVAKRAYRLATVRPEHRDFDRARPCTAPTAARPKVVEHPKSKHLPAASNTCARCGKSDWEVSVKEPDGRHLHVACWQAENTGENGK